MVEEGVDLMNESTVVMEFPLRGEWLAPTTPAKRIPSHGTNRMGLRYAFDFLQVNWQKNKRPFKKINALRYILFGAPLKFFYCYGQEIFAPCDGEIVTVIDGVKERKTVHWLVDLAIGLKNAVTFNENRDQFSQIAGNYLVIKKSANVYVVLAHLQTSSLTVSIGDQVKKGDLVGKVGHSGNSTSPHLHFQVMDSQDIATAKGIPCLFEEYELFESDSWNTIYKQLPADTDQFRFYKEDDQLS